MKHRVIPAFWRGASDTAEAGIPLRFIPAYGPAADDKTNVTVRDGVANVGVRKLTRNL